jgi:hypothetical protein
LGPVVVRLTTSEGKVSVTEGVAALETNTFEARRAIYNRARAVQSYQLGKRQFNKADFDRERSTGIGRPVMNDCSKDLNQADEGDLLRAEVSDEVIEAASMARGGFPTLWYGTYCFACPSRPALSRQVDQQR